VRKSWSKGAIADISLANNILDKLKWKNRGILGRNVF
jgi:hypothetical protein